MRPWATTLLLLLFLVLVLGGLSFFKYLAPTISTPTPNASGDTPLPSSNIVNFASTLGEFSLNYWSNFKLKEASATTTDWRFDNRDQTVGIKYVTITIPKGFEPGTNFSEGIFQVGASRSSLAIANCLNPDFAGQEKFTENMNGIDYVAYKNMTAATGNIYDLTSFRALHAGACYAVELLIHSTNLGNYPAELGLKEFDRERVYNALHQIFESLILKTE